ncbi:Uncharacterized protein GBIM_09387 [Gryllus bimaculatus]|nr:Uncharacterized protein GBIM_09387 [Gryllus bimaculatus]
MKKSYNPVTDVRNENVEGTRRLYRAISDIARNLDEGRDRAQSCTELFLPNAETQRLKLRDYCERLIFSDPLGFGRKGEELLWRKGYYDVVTTAKRLRKNNVWSQDEEAHLQRHLYAGVGHYHHIIFRLQIDFKLDLRGNVDFPLLVNDGGLTKGKLGSSRCQEEGVSEWAHQALHRSLVFLGDLSRYLLELHPEWDSGLPQRYYLQAISLNSDMGMPHNQLGTLSGSQNYSVDAAYHYMRCLILSCLHSFDGAEGNLRRIFERNAKWLEHHNRWNLDDKVEEMPPTERIHRFIARFMVVVDVWFFDKTFPANPSQLCQQMVEDLRHCLMYSKRFPSDSQLSPEHLDLDELLNLDANCDHEKPEYLKDDLVFKLVSMLLLCISRLQAKRSKLLSGLTVFTLAIVSEIVQQVINHIQDSVLTLSIPSLGAPFTPPLLTSENSDPSVASTESSVCVSLSSCPTVPFPEERVKPTLADEIEKTAAPKENGEILPSVNGSLENEGKKKKKKKLKYLSKFRRRRPKISVQNSSEDSDYSDGDLPYGSSSSSDEGNDDISENDEHLIYDEVDDDEDDEDSDTSSTSTQVESKETISDENKQNDKKEVITNGECQSKDSSQDLSEKLLVNGINGCSSETEESVNEISCNSPCIEGEKEEINVSGTGHPNHVIEKGFKSNGQMDPADIIELVAEEGLLQVVKICADWLLGEKEVLKACGRSSPTLLSRIVTMLNLINIDAEVLENRQDSAKFFKLKNISEIFQKVPLTEDVKMKGILVLKEAHELVDWEFCRNYCLHTKEEALLRVYKLVNFGKFLVDIEDIKICYDEKKHQFSMKQEAITEETNLPAINIM